MNSAHDDPLARAEWFTSSRSSSGKDCVEVAHLPTATAVRDSKNPTGPALVFTPSEWAVFTTDIRTGAFDPQ